MTCFVEERKHARAHTHTHTPKIPHEAEKSELTRGQTKDRNKTSYGTLFLLKDVAAPLSLVKEVMHNCNTENHTRPECDRNIHRHINIKVWPIQIFMPI